MKAGLMFVEWYAASVPADMRVPPQSRLSHPPSYCRGEKLPFAPKFRFERTGIFRVAIQGRVMCRWV